jgi:hypothetical protein
MEYRARNYFEGDSRDIFRCICHEKLSLLVREANRVLSEHKPL